jgi:hypothetical protein
LGRPINKHDGHLKPDECGCGFEISTADVGASAIFHLIQFFHGSGFRSTQPKPDLLPSLAPVVGRPSGDDGDGGKAEERCGRWRAAAGTSPSC